jgi:hypothetical protein
MEMSDEEILEKLHDFEVSSVRAAIKSADAPELIIAEYPHKETADNALKEVTNLGGSGRVESATTSKHENNQVTAVTKPVDTSETTLQNVSIRQGDHTHQATIKTEPIKDGCSMEVASAVLKESHPAVRACGQEYASRTKKRPVGQMVFGLVLAESGWPRQIASTKNDIKDPAFTKCLKDALRLRFPNPYRKQCIIQAPFTFTPKPNSAPQK